MSKRSRRGRPRTTRRPITVQPPAPAEAQEQPDFSEYSYVITDLRRVAILAAAMFALLIALSLFIR
jgi:hypothetical protein